MKNSYKISIIVIAFAILIFAGFFISILIHDNLALRSFEDEVANILLPPEIEKIAVRSAIGDSGGNGDYITLRVVWVVKTDLNINELEATIKKNRFLNHNKNNNGIPNFYITRCESSTFKSPVTFELEFYELRGINDYSNYFFIEFGE